MTRTEHLLFLLAEECAEVAQRASKAARFGLSEVQTGQSFTNAERMIHEYADLLAVINLLRKDGVVPTGIDVKAMVAAKENKVERFLRYSAECGALEGRTNG